MRPPGPAGPPGPPGPLDLPTQEDSSAGTTPTLNNTANLFITWGTHTPTLHLEAKTKYLITGYLNFSGTGVSALAGRNVQAQIGDTSGNYGDLTPALFVDIGPKTTSTVHGSFVFSFEYTTDVNPADIAFECWLGGNLTAGSIQASDATIQTTQLCETGTA